MPNLGGWEIVILVVVVLLLFGAKKLPDMARSVGQSARIFKGEMKGMKGDDAKDPKAKADTAPQAQLPASQPTVSQPTVQPTVAAEQQPASVQQPADQRDQ
jgi:sec-independent protein translocase protein TatA